MVYLFTSMLGLHSRLKNHFSICCTVSASALFQSGGGLVAYSDARPFGGAYADAIQTDHKKKKVVVLGTGWAGTSFLKNLKDPSYEVQVVSPRNYFAFTPLLPSVTVGTVEARSIVEPVRNIVKKVEMHIRFHIISEPLLSKQLNFSLLSVSTIDVQVFHIGQCALN